MNIAVKATSIKGVNSLLTAGKAGQHAAGGGLYLKVSGKGTGSWFFRYKVAGRTRRMGLGSADAITLAQARQLAAEQRSVLAQGQDPFESKKALQEASAAENATFDMVAADYIKAQRSVWTNAKHAQQWTNTLATYASPVIGHLAPSKITTEHLLEILQPIWNEKQETANRLRNRIEIVLNAAKVKNLRTGENVAAWSGHLNMLLANYKKKSRRHHPALAWSQANMLWTALRKMDDVGALALQLLMLTAVRTNELLPAHWSEFDLDAGVWVIPAARMKIKKESSEDGNHRVPLSNAALEVLAGIPKTGSGFLFEGRTAGKHASNMIMLMKLRRMDAEKFQKDSIGWRDAKSQIITPHGFRSTFRDWAAENTSVANIVLEQALAHAISSEVEAAYRRGDLLQRREEIMEAWGQYVKGQKTTVKLKKLEPII